MHGCFGIYLFACLMNLEEIQGLYQIKVTTTALGLLLRTRHVELENVNVQGQIIKVIVFLFAHYAYSQDPSPFNI